VTVLSVAPATRASDLLRVSAERRLVRLLRGLGADWAVVPSVPVQGCPRAVLAIGPSGAVLVAPRWYVGRKVWVGAGLVIVDGVKSDDVPRARAHAATASGLLTRALDRDVPVLGAVAVLSEKRTVRSQPVEGDVLVHGSRGLVAALATRPAVLSATAVAEIARVADDLATWYPLGASRPAVRAPIHSG
jgi:hypothetical protein